MSDASFTVVRRGKWLYDGSSAQPVVVVRLRDFSDGTFDSDHESLERQFSNGRGKIEAYMVVFGELNEGCLATASAGPFSTVAEAMTEAQSKAPTAITWRAGS